MAFTDTSTTRTAFADTFEPALLESPRAGEMRAAHATWEEHEATLAAMQAPLPPAPTLDARLAPLLARGEAGESGVWPATCTELLRDSLAHRHIGRGTVLAMYAEDRYPYVCKPRIYRGYIALDPLLRVLAELPVYVVWH